MSFLSLLDSDFAPLRKIFFLALRYVNKYDYKDLPICGSRYLGLFIVCCHAIDNNRSLGAGNTQVKRDYKKACLIVISKVSRDLAYRGMMDNIIDGIKKGDL